MPTAEAETKRELTFRPKVFARAFRRRPHPALCLLIIWTAWLLAGLLSPTDLVGQLRLSAAGLQLSGLFVLVGQLWNRGTVFGRPHPLAEIRTFGRELKLAFRKPRRVTLRVDSGVHALSAASAELTVRRKETLEETVARLEQELGGVKKDLREHKTESGKKLQELDKKWGDQLQGVEEQVKKHRADAESALVGSYALEWVAVVWLLAGMSLGLIAEFLA